MWGIGIGGEGSLTQELDKLANRCLEVCSMGWSLTQSLIHLPIMLGSLHEFAQQRELIVAEGTVCKELLNCSIQDKDRAEGEIGVGWAWDLKGLALVLPPIQNLGVGGRCFLTQAIPSGKGSDWQKLGIVWVGLKAMIGE
jgi:hypothetical protein